MPRHALTTLVRFQRGLSGKGSDEREREREGANGELRCLRPPVPGQGCWAEQRGDTGTRCARHTGLEASYSPHLAFSSFEGRERPTFFSLPCSVLLPSHVPWSPGTPPASESFLDISTQCHAAPACSPIFLVCLDSNLLTKSTPWVCLSRHRLQSGAKGRPTESLNKHMLVDLSIVKDTAIISSRAFFVGLPQGEKRV